MSDTTTTPAGTGTETAAPVTGAPETTTTAPATPSPETQAPDTAATPAKDGTILDGAVTDKTAAVPADWPSDWRQKAAGGDKKLEERLGRFNSPLDLTKSYTELEKRFSAGDVKKPLPENATPEQLAEWRKEHDVPVEASGYEIKLPNGVVLGEADKPVVEGFTQYVHEKNWDNAKVNEALDWYYTELDRQQKARAESDFTTKQQSEDALRQEWGPEFRPNVNAVNNLLEGLPAEQKNLFLGGRLADGTKIGDSPYIIKWLSQISRDLNPAATLVPAGTSDAGKSIGDEIATLENLMRDKSSDYWRGAKAEAMQQRYRDLVDARDRLKDRAA